MAGPGGTVVVVVVAGPGGTVVLVVVAGPGGTVVVVVLVVVVVVEGAALSVVGGVLVVDDSVRSLVVVVVRSIAVPAVGMAGKSVTWPRTEPTAVSAMVIATRVAALHATTNPIRRIMSTLCRTRPTPGITVR